MLGSYIFYVTPILKKYIQTPTLNSVKFIDSRAGVLRSGVLGNYHVCDGIDKNSVLLRDGRTII